MTPEARTSRRREPRANSPFRVGIQLKSVLILAFVVISIVVAGGWFYFITARNALQAADRRHALRLADTLAMAAARELDNGAGEALHHLAADAIRADTVRYAAVVGADGDILAAASSAGQVGRWERLTDLPVPLRAAEQVGPHLLRVARPVVSRESEGVDALIGSVRLIVDNHKSAESLVAVQQRMGVIAAGVVLCAMPLGYLLVWRVMVQPIRRLVRSARRLEGGDFTIRMGVDRQDEIGELSSALDHMVEQISAAHEQLRISNEMLESKVARRTEELQRANRRLRDEMAERDDFLRAVSHDLNAPLRNVAGMADLLLARHGEQLPADALERVRRIRANIDVETELIGELLELSHIRTRPQTRTLVDMNELISEVLDSLEFELRNREIDVTVDEAMPVIYVEKARLRQVFLNLIDNAVKYMDRPDGGRIDIGYRFSDGMHDFSVSDNGPGVNADDREKIFYVFRRGPAAAEVEGKGVGLALVRTVAANYEGRAWVEAGPEGGAAFHVVLAAHCTEPPPDLDAGAARTPAAAWRADREIPAGQGSATP